MENTQFWLLPLLTILVIGLNYRLNMVEGNNKKGALCEACWWGGSFFTYGIADYFLLVLNAS